MVATFISVCKAGLNFKEKMFMVVAWLPKATAQAALGSVFLDVSHKHGAEHYYHMGEQILTLAVVSILITAPLGSAAIIALGPYLLSKDESCARRGTNHKSHSHVRLKMKSLNWHNFTIHKYIGLI